MAPLRAHLRREHDVYHIGFSTRPAKLFDGTEQRLTIYIQVPGGTRLLSGGYLKWSKEERDSLFQCLSYCEAEPMAHRHGLWPKLRPGIEATSFERMLTQRALQDAQVLGSGSYLYYKSTGIRYFSTVTLRPPRCWINGVATSSSRETLLGVDPRFRHAVHSFLLSTTFFRFYQATSNCRDLNPSDILLSPMPDVSGSLRVFERLSKAVEEDYTAKATILRMNNRLTGAVEVESLTPARSKPIIDEIDRVLAKHYGFTDEELDFIINYDIKYRMGREGQNAGD